MFTHKQLEEYILTMPNARLEYPFGAETAVYKVGEKMFAIIAEGSQPVRLSLKCDPQLATVLRERYLSVQPGYHLNKKHWNTIICTGEIPENEIHDFIRHSYHLVASV